MAQPDRLHGTLKDIVERPQTEAEVPAVPVGPDASR